MSQTSQRMGILLNEINAWSYGGAVHTYDVYATWTGAHIYGRKRDYGSNVPDLNTYSIGPSMHAFILQSVHMYGTNTRMDV